MPAGGVWVAWSGLFAEVELRPEAEWVALTVATLSIAANFGWAWISTRGALTAAAP